MSTASNTRIAKNTAMLYFRMLFTMGVTLYTSRIVLYVLGVENYGIYNVVGGVVILFTFLNGAMSASTSRFLTFALGRHDSEELKKTFSAALTLHIIIAFIILLLAETVGLWFVLNKLVVPAARMNATIWVYQLSILTCVVSLIQVPYNAAIIAHERMSVYAYVSIIDVSLKLAVVFLLKWFVPFDKLVFYSFLIFCSTLIVVSIYRIYCKRQYEECVYHICWDKPTYQKMINFSGWSLLGNFAWIMLTEGSNILMNLFFGPVVNAAQAVTMQVNSAVTSFVNNFRTAVNPQIIKLYASDRKSEMFNLVFQSGKYSYFILFVLVLPILLETEFILNLWLKVVPQYTVLLVKLALINSLVSTLDMSAFIVLQAVGRLKESALIGSSSILLFVLPLSFILFHFGFAPSIFYYVMIINSFLFSFGIRPYLLHKIAEMNIKEYFAHVVFPVVKVTVAAAIVPIGVTLYMPDSIFRFFLICLVSAISVGIGVYYLGMDSITKKMLALWVKAKFSKLATKP
ncbi:lipopolysaccharide biosynthesis protein [Paludibacter jiangxiensis]|uniref:Na+-driven multidrug efflux pump n=1 Tax=Paludibacter jiangxiensis TaxID=681398 RepID=A0A171AMU4_9BACT|nr:lipopolysaccharide biosynthesis protein [Paludibacter jiangxiensis]GAT63999.1 Na+-driven multidrug efflux pump [Paludibacter jiangxiensis]